MKNNIRIYALSAVLATAPSVAFAQNDLFGLLTKVQTFMNALVPVIITLALLYFLYGVVTYIQSPDDKEAARNTMIWGLIALFVMVSVWGLVNLIAATVGTDRGGNTPPVLPFIDPSKVQR